MKKTILILIFVSLFALWPFFKKGYFESHDGEWMVIRFSAFHQTLRAGQFPVRFVERLNNNYGYPVANFLYPLPFYLAEIPKALGIGFVASIKTVFVVSSALSVAAMFWALSQKFSKMSSFAASLVYLFIPYRFVDLYIRGSLGESVAFLFLPLIFGSILKISKDDKIFLPLLSIFTALLILSHNVMAALFIPIFFIIAALAAKNYIKEITMYFLVGFAISAFFWFPALYDLHLVKLSQTNISSPSDHLASFQNLISPVWSYGSTTIGASLLPVQFGVVSILLFLAALYLQFFKKVKNKLVGFFLILYISGAILMLKFSLPFWQINPITQLIQFPWRLLSIVVFATSIFAAYCIEYSHKKTQAAVILSIIAIISTIAYTRPFAFVDRGDSFYTTNEGTTTVRDEYMPTWVKIKPNTRADQKIVVDPSIAAIIFQEIKATNYSAKISSKEATEVVVNSIYFPGWQVKIDGKNTPINYANPNGLITFTLPQGIHEVIIKYNRSSVHLASELASLLALVATSILFLNLWRKQNS